MEKTFNYVGIDISKLTFDVSLQEGGKHLHKQFSNDTKGFKALTKCLSQDHCCVMEASGPYYLKLAFYLLDQGIAVSVVNPLIIRRFSQMRMMRAKTDKKDAAVIAEYGRTEKPVLWEKESEYSLELKQLQACQQLLNKNKGALIRQQQAFSANPVKNKVVSMGLKRQIRSIDSELLRIEREMLAIIEMHHKEQFAQLTSIPGIGPKAAMALIVLSGGFSRFSSAKQLSSYIGLAPRIFESGTSVKGKTKICKMGMSRIRAILYVCSWSAIKKNKACKELFERIVEKGKSKKLALVAVMNKLVKQAFAIATSGNYYYEEKPNFACI